MLIKPDAPAEPSAFSLIRDPGGDYRATRSLISAEEILAVAEEIIALRFLRHGRITTVAELKCFVRLHLIRQERELFWGLFLDRGYRVIAWEVLFQGTIDSCAVHPRDVVKCALAHNCCQVIFAHQHPSGDPEPSAADQQLTRQLKAALATVDIRLLDHIVVGALDSVSFSERGWL